MNDGTRWNKHRKPFSIGRRQWWSNINKKERERERTAHTQAYEKTFNDGIYVRIISYRSIHWTLISVPYSIIDWTTSINIRLISVNLSNLQAKSNVEAKEGKRKATHQKQLLSHLQGNSKKSTKLNRLPKSWGKYLVRSWTYWKIIHNSFNQIHIYGQNEQLINNKYSNYSKWCRRFMNIM